MFKNYICQVRQEIKNTLERQIGKAMINSFASLRPTVRTSADPIFDLQSTVIQNNTEIEVTGNSFVHPILTEVPVQDINSELRYVPASDEPNASAGNQRRRNHVPANITKDGKRQKNQRQQRPPEDKGKKTKCPNKLCGKKDHKKPKLCEFAMLCRYQSQLPSNSPEKIPLHGLDFHDAMRKHWNETKEQNT